MELNFEDKKIAFKDVPILSYLSEEEINSMNSSFEVERVSKGEAIFKSGHPANVMFIVYEGIFKLMKPLSDGREQILYIFKAGDFVGGLNILSGDKYVYNGVCLTDCVIIKISSCDFKNVLLKNREFLLKLLEKTYERVRKSESLIDVLSGINANMKVAKLLINFAQIYGKITREGILLNLDINREELGFYSGITRETISRKLNQFEKADYIKLLPKGRILIRSIENLYDLIWRWNNEKN